MTVAEILQGGMLGEPLPYLLRTDWMVTSTLFLCILLVSFIVSRGKKHLMQELKRFVQNRERYSMFDEVTAADARHTFLLVCHTCVMLGLCAYRYFSETVPHLFDKMSHLLLLGGLVLGFAFYVVWKWIAYNFVNWVFFQKARNILWITSFFHLYIWMGILLLPLVLVTVYFDISSQTALNMVGFLFVFTKILQFWKCFNNFFEKIYGTFHLILYFCALEIIPDLILWKGMEMISSNLTLNL